LLFLKTTSSTTELKDKVLSAKWTYLRILALVDILFVLYNHMGIVGDFHAAGHSRNFHDRDAGSNVVGQRTENL
jgi:hypothetical protein